MRLYTLKPGKGAHKRKFRVGRGIGSGLGKTCGRGVKGSGARKSPNKRPGFEGGQMPLKIRLPKFGFWSRKAYLTDEVPLNSLNKVEGDLVNLKTLREAGLINSRVRFVKIVLSHVPNFTRKVKVEGVGVTRGAQAAIEAAGGTVEISQFVLSQRERHEKNQRRSAAKRQALLDALMKNGIQRPAKKDKAAKAAKAKASKSN
ncbi:MAG: 50S ribosomal protein L15 [Succinivibrionaceae bacterium]|nr:50S ribosomal protein L15 [Succinivibrionaceae bacterium]